MSMKADAADVRRELQRFLSEERDLVQKAENAIASGHYVKLAEIADALVKLTERRTLLRATLLEAQALERARQAKEADPRRASDQSSDTWRLLR